MYIYIYIYIYTLHIYVHIYMYLYVYNHILYTRHVHYIRHMISIALSRVHRPPKSPRRHLPQVAYFGASINCRHLSAGKIAAKQLVMDLHPVAKFGMLQGFIPAEVQENMRKFLLLLFQCFP